MSNNCSICFKALSRADVINVLSSDIRRELNDVVVFSLEAPLGDDSRLCKSCHAELNVRMNIKANLREADQRIRQINHGAIIAKVSPKPSLIERQSPQRREMNIFREKYTREASDIKRGNASLLGCVKSEVKSEGISSFKHENGSVKSEKLCKEADSTLYELAKELWGDDVKCKETSNKENM